MRPQKVENEILLDGLMSVLRSKGYDGASLNELASSTGLQKASLYHRFPGGKKEITMAVLDHVDEWLNMHVFAVLQQRDRLPEERLSSVLVNVKELYQAGEAICIIRALSMETGLALFGEKLKNSMNSWIDSFSVLGQDIGLNKNEADQKAVRVVVKIQGSLIVSKTLQSTKPFIDALKEIEMMYQGT